MIAETYGRFIRIVDVILLESDIYCSKQKHISVNPNHNLSKNSAKRGMLIS
jgi:hypothetical protein